MEGGKNTVRMVQNHHQFNLQRRQQAGVRKLQRYLASLFRLKSIHQNPGKQAKPYMESHRGVSWRLQIFSNRPTIQRETNIREVLGAARLQKWTLKNGSILQHETSAREVLEIPR